MLIIIFLFGFWALKPNDITVIDEQDSPAIQVWVWENEKIKSRSSHQAAKLTGSKTSNFIKKQTPMQMSSCKFCGIFMDIFFIEYLWATVLLLSIFRL